MNIQIQFMMSVMLCFASSSLAASADSFTCDASLEDAPAKTLPAPSWPIDAAPGYICGVKDLGNSIVYHHCRTCSLTTTGQNCQLTNNATAPIAASEKCDTYGPDSIIDITKDTKYNCKNTQDYTCLAITNPSVCNECVAYP
ncbi:uncharacterized protein MELLADRAFT_124211 [Melampsora larici-populina 98AG31]|uniref:Secreted protein n=1 Tax=Melampsora larici-populina (strain 98AG31 / pathotype 3-4-7) TaxID=747676 RepID=F4SCV4_MELLP|nr:uncharacterized protein MELLADRAFT_124211 [Melampsora larici-populina 98AG31]EGF97515.1 secreted protein [Melampsora larici-populina 98AG31]